MSSIYLSHYITAREAREVARALKNSGYHTATRENCREYVMNVANHFEPGDVGAREKLLRVICQAAGIQPRTE